MTVITMLVPIPFLPADLKTKSISGILKRLLPRLHEEGILTGDLGTPEDDGALEAKYMGICRRSPEDKMRRIGMPIVHSREPLAYWGILDILTIPTHQWGAALVYFTGDDIVSCYLPVY
jgi:DNA polymerase lambda